MPSPNPSREDQGHTPGPWRQAKRRPHHVIVHTPEGTIRKIVASAATDSDLFTEAEWTANARLIAAAPAMYEALKAQEDRYRRGALHMTVEELDRVTELRRAALTQVREG